MNYEANNQSIIKGWRKLTKISQTWPTSANVDQLIIFSKFEISNTIVQSFGGKILFLADMLKL